MYRNKQKDIPEGALKVIRAICADYPRRKRIIETVVHTHTDEETLKHFKDYNERIDRALSELEEGLRDYILSDIMHGNGYNYSMASPLLTNNAYYERKNKILWNLARELNLVI